jgi:hypothetical protein
MNLLAARERTCLTGDASDKRREGSELPRNGTTAEFRSDLRLMVIPAKQGKPRCFGTLLGGRAGSVSCHATVL